MSPRRRGRLSRLVLKELREILRDRRTIVTLVMMPLLVYPLLNLAFQRFLVTSLQAGSEPSTSWVVRVEPPVEAPHFERLIQEAQRLGAAQRDARPQLEAGSGTSGNPATLTKEKAPETPPKIRWLHVDGARELPETVADLTVMVHRAPDTSLHCELLYQPDSPTSRAAQQYFEQRLLMLNNESLRRQLSQMRATPWDAFTASSRGIHAPGSGPVSMAALIPLILVLMTVTGAVYPAIDLTAGERERGTLEALMATPVSHFHLLLAKYVAVVTVAVLTAVVNLMAMSATILAGGLAPLLFGDVGLSLASVAQVLTLLLVFAAFFSAVLLVLTSTARSFKEAQAYLIPLMLMSLGPGILSLIPGIELTVWLSLTPLLNIVLVARDVFSGQSVAGPTAIAIASTTLYTLGALSLAARWFGEDAVNSGSAGAARPQSSQPGASLSVASITMVVIFFCFYSLGGWLGQQSQLSDLARLAWAGALTAVLFGAIPLLASRVERLPPRGALRLHAAPRLAFPAALAMGLSLWVVAHQLLAFGESLGIVVLDAERFELAQEMIRRWRALPLHWILLSTAVAPAVFEELAFRGYLFASLRRRMRPAWVILITAVVFGAFHGVTSGQPSIERVLPSTFLGLILGWTAWRSGSVLPGMALHACSNGLLLTLAYYQHDLEQSSWGPWLQRVNHQDTYWLPWSWVGAACGVAGCGALLLWWATRTSCAASDAASSTAPPASRSVPADDTTADTSAN